MLVVKRKIVPSEKSSFPLASSKTQYKILMSLTKYLPTARADVRVTKTKYKKNRNASDKQVPDPIDTQTRCLVRFTFCHNLAYFNVIAAPKWTL